MNETDMMQAQATHLTEVLLAGIQRELNMAGQIASLRKALDAALKETAEVRQKLSTPQS
jgi:hypothetical protein